MPDLLVANSAFYDAFAAGDAEAMCALWARRHALACIHPGWPALTEREAVLESWQRILASPPAIRHSDAIAYLLGEVGFVICTERVERAGLAATNIFVLEDGVWRMVHHQAGPAVAGAAESDTPRHAVH